MRRRRAKPRVCLVDGCPAVIAGWKVICDLHFQALPGKTRQLIAQARADKAPHIASRLLVDGAAALASRDRTAAAETARRLGEREP